jgi:anti-anti-sigma factor
MAVDRPHAVGNTVSNGNNRRDNPGRHRSNDERPSISAAQRPSHIRLTYPERHAADPTTLEVTTDVATRRLILIGELDRFTGSSLTEDSATLMVINPGDTTVDLSDVSFIDAGGLGRLVRLRNNLARHRATLTVANPSDRLRKTFQLGRLQSMLPSAPDTAIH